MLHAAAFERSISRTLLLNPLISYASFATSELYRPEFIHATVPGALTLYDLPDLAAAIAPRSLTLVGATDAQGVPMEPSAVAEAYRVAMDAFRARGEPDAFRILPPDSGAGTSGLLRR
jgi:hypothetical protein